MTHFQRAALLQCGSLSTSPQTYGNCYFNHTIQYVHPVIHSHSCCRPLLRPHLLQLAGAVSELRSVCLEHTLSLVGLLHKVLVALLVGKVDRVFLGVEVQAGALHVVCAGLPAHEGVLPSVALGQDIPVDAPLVTVPVSGLSGGLCGAVDAALQSVLATCDRIEQRFGHTEQSWPGGRSVRRTKQRRGCQGQARSRS